jgi:aspartyl/glutamyl-tRNA(Asn/Gln) amidotransferase C subunit
MKNVWREDQVQKMTEPETLMAQAPEQQEGQVKVPQVVK